MQFCNHSACTNSYSSLLYFMYLSFCRWAWCSTQLHSMFSVTAPSRRPPQWSTPSTSQWQTSWWISLFRPASCSTTVEGHVLPAPTCTSSATLSTCTAVSCFWLAYVLTATLPLYKWVSFLYQLHSLKPKLSLYSILDLLIYSLMSLQVEASRRWRNSSVAKCVCVSVWLFAIVVTYSFLSSVFQHTGCCLSKLLFLTITEFFLPLVIIVVFTLRIMWALADRRLMQQSRYQYSIMCT